MRKVPKDNPDRQIGEFFRARARTCFVKLDLDEAFTDVLTGVSGMLELRLTEELHYSGTQWAVQPTVKNPDGTGGYSVPQDLSVAEGSRTIRGSALASDRRL